MGVFLITKEWYLNRDYDEEDVVDVRVVEEMRMVKTRERICKVSAGLEGEEAKDKVKESDHGGGSERAK
ncbi:hypothetical protein Scep_001378 [Stephania cephalantha]|uniref:Uncharacterized protein n=1 Tax=Stephania cephalantha TaxID=152367 RepID=A0AAP0L9A3_9MAGN